MITLALPIRSRFLTERLAPTDLFYPPEGRAYGDLGSRKRATEPDPATVDEVCDRHHHHLIVSCCFGHGLDEIQ